MALLAMLVRASQGKKREGRSGDRPSLFVRLIAAVLTCDPSSLARSSGRGSGLRSAVLRGGVWLPAGNYWGRGLRKYIKIRIFLSVGKYDLCQSNPCDSWQIRMTVLKRCRSHFVTRRAGSCSWSSKGKSQRISNLCRVSARVCMKFGCGIKRASRACSMSPSFPRLSMCCIALKRRPRRRTIATSS